jgi:hypothetical protein
MVFHQLWAYFHALHSHTSARLTIPNPFLRNSSFFSPTKTTRFMEKKIFLGTLGAWVAGTAVSMAIFMGIFSSMAEQWMADNKDCLVEMNMVWWFVSGLVISLLMAILLHKFGVSTFKGGAIAAAWVMLFVTLFYGIANASTYKAYPWSWLPYDLIANVVTAAIAGGVIGWIYGKVK